MALTCALDFFGKALRNSMGRRWRGAPPPPPVRQARREALEALTTIPSYYLQAECIQKKPLDSSSMLLKRSTSLAEPMQRAVRWSTASIFTSRTEPPVTPSEVLPPAWGDGFRV